MNTCSLVYERIATGELHSRLVYKNLEHGVMALLDPMPVAEGHITVATLACAPSTDAIKSPVLYNKMMTVAKFAGRVLSEVYPDAPYISALTASNQIRHPHSHRAQADEDANWAKRFAKLEAWPPPATKSEFHGSYPGSANWFERCTGAMASLRRRSNCLRRP
jgi:diadenosine tetraphosphate (Ap4A) HIT family hydrolase